MEERILDEDESRSIKLKRTKDGETDAVDALADEAEEEAVVEFPEMEFAGDGEYDEDLVGLTPSQLRAELEKRAKAKREAREESKKLTAQAAEKLAAENFADAELLYTQALVCDFENGEAREGLWTARTRGFTDEEALFREGAAEELAGDEQARAFVVPHFEQRLRDLRAQYAAEEEEVRPAFEQQQGARRDAFSANRKYYLVRFAVFFLTAVVFAIGIAVSASFLYRTQNMVPLALVIAFSALTLISLIVAVVFSRKLFVASRLCGENEKLSSTESGARLQFLQERLRAIDLVLGEEHGENEE